MSTGAARSAEQPSQAPAKRTGLPRLWEEFGWLVLALALAFAIRSFVIEPYRIPSGSMLPTLLIGDHLFVNKFVYGIKIPFTDARLPALRDPQRGDVVVFTVARDPTALGPDRSVRPADRRRDLPRDRFVKRIVGLPGDEIEVRNSGVWLNGERVSERETGRTMRDEANRELAVRVAEVNGCVHAVLDDPRRPGPEARFVVEPGRYFVMGDNRDHSNDSRTWGTVRRAELKGPAFLLYWSWDWNGTWGALLNPLTWWENLTQRMRWGRLGDRIGCGRGLEAAGP